MQPKDVCATTMCSSFLLAPDSDVTYLLFNTHEKCMIYWQQIRYELLHPHSSTCFPHNNRAAVWNSLGLGAGEEGLKVPPPSHTHIFPEPKWLRI